MLKNKIIGGFLTIVILSGFFPYKKAEALFYVDTLLADLSCEAYEATIGKIVDRAKERAEDRIEAEAENILGGGIVISTNVPVVDTLVANKIERSANKITTKEEKLSCQETLKKIAIGVLKKRILDVMVDQTVSWIQGNGKPQFVTDYKAFLQNTQNVVIGDIVQEIGLGRICEPFKFQLQVLVAQPRPFSTRAACTLSDIVGNINDFYNNFADGGWIAYNEALKPQNNIYGAFLLAEEEKGSRLAAELDAAANEVAAGGGFLSQKRCLFWSRLEEHGGKTTTVSVPDNGKNQPPDNNGWECTQAEIITPGKTIGDTVSKAIGSDFDYIINAEDIGAYVSAIADAALNRLIKETVNGISQMRAPTINLNEGRAVTGCEGLSSTQKAICESETENYYDRTANQYTNAKQNGIIGLRTNAHNIINQVRNLEGGISTLQENTLTKINDFEACYADKNVGLVGEQQISLDTASDEVDLIKAETLDLDVETIASQREAFNESLNNNENAYPNPQNIPANEIDSILEELSNFNDELLAFLDWVTDIKNTTQQDNDKVVAHLTMCNALPGGGPR